MLFHTWPFLVFILVVLPVYFALKRTRLWLPWLMVASYFFYGWWNPYYLILVFYSTVLDYLLVTLMDHCPREGQAVNGRERFARLHFGDGTLKIAFVVSLALTLAAMCVLAFTLLLNVWMSPLPAALFSTLIVGSALAALGYSLVKKGGKDLNPARFVPRQTLDSVKKDARWAKERMV